MADGVWSEFLPYPEVERWLPLLKSHHCDLYLGIPSRQIGHPDLARLLHCAVETQVSIHAWLLLPDEEGYWPNALNVDRFTQVTHQWLFWLRQLNLSVPWLVIDMEPGLQHSQQVMQAIKQKQWPTVYRHLRKKNRHQYNHAVGKYNELLQTLHQQNVQGMVVTYPLIIDDLMDGQERLQQALHIPVTGVFWDKVSLLTYRTSFRHLTGLSVSPGFIADYMKQAQQFFACPVAAALGVVGQVEKMEPQGGYQRPDELAQDIAAARAVGINECHLFSLDGMVQSGNPDAWLTTLQTSPQEFPMQRPDRLLRQGFYWMDRLL